MNSKKFTPSQRSELNRLDERQNGMIKNLLFVIFSLALIFSVIELAPAQSTSRRWIYAATSGDGAKLYYREGIKKISPNRRRGWVKLIFPDKSFAIASHIWDCKQSIGKTTSINMYDRRGVVTEKTRGLDWQEIIPDSINETLLLRVCEIRKDNTWLEIKSKNANLRSTKSLASRVLRIAQKGQRFRVIEYRKNDFWFNVVDEKTQQDYWIHRTTVKIINPRNRKRRRK